MRLKDLREYSKRIIHGMIVLWFSGAVFGAAVIVVELIATLAGTDGYSAALVVHLPELLMYIGAPVGGGIVGYLLKSAFENREKIKRGGESGDDSCGFHPPEDVP